MYRIVVALHYTTQRVQIHIRSGIVSAALVLALSAAAATSPSVLRGDRIRVVVSTVESGPAETVQILDGKSWVPALDTSASLTQVRAAGKTEACRVVSAELTGGKILTKAKCGDSTVERELQLGPDPDTVAVKVRFVPGRPVQSVEDRMFFAPAPRHEDTPERGPLDFVWSQNLKSAEDMLIPHWGFKSPAVMFQQARIFAAIVPRVDLLTANDLRNAPVALDLDVTSNSRAWFSYGVVPSAPYGHSYFRRITGSASSDAIRDPVSYQYWIVASSQPERLGYGRISRLLWEKFGSPALKQTLNLQQNVRRPELFLFDDWRQEAWVRYANEKYFEFDCGGQRCGALTSNRNPGGRFNDAPKEDAWFNAWFQNLRTAYGWRLYATHSNNQEMRRKAEQVLTLALKSPQDHGLFSTIYIHDTNTWQKEDGWAGYADDYHTFCMSWTGYWMLRWASDLTPERKTEVLAFLRPYADFLLTAQQPSGEIPSWFDSNRQPREEFRDFNAETAGSALFLAQFSGFAGDAKYLQAAIRAQQFIEREVLPRQRWYDFETFRSCARKPFTFYDRWTAQYPQNNLSTMQAVQAYMQIYRLTGQPKYLQTGQRVLDYLLLTQQVWNHPLFAPKLLGGTTTQNTDAEWSDARECYLATLLLDYYQSTGRLEYLERAVAAARSGFAVAPWENWAHTGYPDQQGALTGIHWGTGSEMASVEMMSGVLGDAYINVQRAHGAGFNACTLSGVHVDGHRISFNLKAAMSPRRLVVKFSGVDPQANYKLVVNGRAAGDANGRMLATTGYAVTN